MLCEGDVVTMRNATMHGGKGNATAGMIYFLSTMVQHHQHHHYVTLTNTPFSQTSGHAQQEAGKPSPKCPLSTVVQQPVTVARGGTSHGGPPSWDSPS